jgi:hypothetical protein
MEIDEHLRERIRTYHGDLASLEVALGSYLVAREYGWKVIAVCHSAATVTRSKEILGVDIKEIFPARTALSRRVNGIRLADALGKFWEVARGRDPTKKLVNDDDKNQPELAL